LTTTIPQDDATRKSAPMFRGLLGYFPWALFKIAAHSFQSDRKHNPASTTGPHWTRDKSTDHADCCLRHLADLTGPPPGDFEGDALDWEEYHLTALAWRSSALLQEFGEKHRGAAPGCRSVFPDTAAQLVAKIKEARAELAGDRFAGLSGGPDTDEYASDAVVFPGIEPGGWR
jgi:hypothetical protein